MLFAVNSGKKEQIASHSETIISPFLLNCTSAAFHIEDSHKSPFLVLNVLVNSLLNLNFLCVFVKPVVDLEYILLEIIFCVLSAVFL
jgi:hypothetical protein